MLLFHRRLGVELGKSVVFQESNGGEESVMALSVKFLMLKLRRTSNYNNSKLDIYLATIKN